MRTHGAVVAAVLDRQPDPSPGEAKESTGYDSGKRGVRGVARNCRAHNRRCREISAAPVRLFPFVREQLFSYSLSYGVVQLAVVRPWGFRYRV